MGASGARGRGDQGTAALKAGGGRTGAVSFWRGGWPTHAQAGGRPRVGDGEIPRAPLPHAWQPRRGWLLLRAGPEPGSGRAGGRRGARAEASGGGGTRRACDRVAAEKRTRCRRRSSSCSSSRGRRRRRLRRCRSFTPDPRREPQRGAELPPLPELQRSSACGEPARVGAQAAFHGPGLGARRPSRSGSQPRGPATAPTPPTLPPCSEPLRWPCAPAARG